MSDYLGDFNINSNVYYKFSTNDGSGGRIEPVSAFDNTDVRIYKNDSATQRASVSGVVMTSPFDSMVGIQDIRIDLSDNDDPGYYTSASDYNVVLYPDKTVDSQNVSKVLFSFSIQNRYTRGTDSASLASELSAHDAKIDIAQLSLNTISADVSGLDGSVMRGTDSASLATSLSAHDLKLDIAQLSLNTISADVSGLDGSVMRGTDSALTLTDISLSAIADAIWNETTSGHTTANTYGNEVATSAGILLTQLAESYASQGTSATASQLLYMIWSRLKSLVDVNTTSPDSLKLDDETVAMTFTTDSALTPTQMIRNT